MDERTMCIYHGRCDDGFASAWVMRKAFGEVNLEFIAANYAEDPPDVTDRKVYLVDFSYKREVLEEMSKKAQQIVILDHHKTAKEEVQPLLDDLSGNVIGVIDMEHSGCMLTWRWFFGCEQPPDLLFYIQDRDLWLKQLPANDFVITALRSYPYDFKEWDKLMQVPIDDLIKEGAPIMRYHRRLVDEAKSRMVIRAFPEKYGVPYEEHNVPTVNVPKYLASEVAGDLCEDLDPDTGEQFPFACCYWYDDTGKIEFSLRSKGKFDVADYASRNFGGGGHKNAAGFRVDTFEEAMHLRND